MFHVTTAKNNNNTCDIVMVSLLYLADTDCYDLRNNTYNSLNT